MTEEIRSPLVLYLRRKWVRLLVAIPCVVGAVLAADFTPHRELLRKQVVEALPSTLFLFGIIVGLATYLVSNHVRGVHAAAIATVARGRNAIWAYRDKYRDSVDPALEGIFVNNLLDLASRKEEEWLEPNNVQGWSTALAEHLQEIIDPRDRIEAFSRYLMPLQEAVDELMVLWVRSAVGELHLTSISGTVFLLVIAVAVNIAIRLFPPGRSWDLFAIGLATTVVTFTLLELLMIFGFVTLEVSDESTSFRNAEEAWSNSMKEAENESSGRGAA